MCSLVGGSDCIKANAKSCGECIQAGPNCGWCKKTVSVAKFLVWFVFLDFNKFFKCIEMLIFPGSSLL